MPLREVLPTESLVAGLRIIDLIAGARLAMSVEEIAEATELAETEAMTAVRVLEKWGYLAADPWEPGFVAGSKLARNLTEAGRELEALRRAAPAVLEPVVKETRISAMAVYWDGGAMQVAAARAAPGGIMLPTVGQVSRNLAESPWGWIFFDALDERRQRHFVRSLGDAEAFREKIRGRLRFLRRHHFAYDQTPKGGDQRRSLAAPVFGRKRLMAALALCADVESLPDREIRAVARTVKSHARDLTDQLSRE